MSDGDAFNRVERMRFIDWRTTVAFFVSRWLVMTVILGIIVVPASQSPTTSLLGSALALLLFWPIVFLATLFVHFVFSRMAMSWLLTRLVALFWCAGDPLLYIINRLFPKLYRGMDLKIINFEPFLYAYRTIEIMHLFFSYGLSDEGPSHKVFSSICRLLKEFDPEPLTAMRGWAGSMQNDESFKATVEQLNEVNCSEFGLEESVRNLQRESARRGDGTISEPTDRILDLIRPGFLSAG